MGSATLLPTSIKEKGATTCQNPWAHCQMPPILLITLVLPCTLQFGQVTVDVGGCSKPFKARVDQMCVEADLALLKVAASSLREFEDHVEPMRLRSALPHLQEKLQVSVSFPAV